MPYRHAHWWLIALLPVIVIAFWPNYFGVIRSAPFALHAHGIAATLWIVLTALQSWTIATRRNALHRSAGLGLFVLVPAFAAGTLLTLWNAAFLYAANTDPFHGRYSARLAVDDLLALATFLLLIDLALVNRRVVRLHAAAMLATVMLVLPPILGRLLPMLPGLPHRFVFGFYAGQTLSTLLALWFWSRNRRSGAAFLIVAASNLLQIVLFPSLAASAAWGRLYAQARFLPPVPLAIAGAALAGAVLWHGWTGGRRLGRQAAPA